MELRHLRSFIAVAEELHFGRAAERLNLAQSPLSQQIKRLERELGVRLFERSRRKVELTEAGRAMLDEARAAIAHADRAADAARGAAEGRYGVLDVGFLGTAALELLPRIVPPFRAHAPGAELRLVEAASRELLAALRQRRLDVVFARPPSPASTLQIEPVWSEPLVVALPAAHALAAKPRLPLRDLADEPFVLFPRQSAPEFHDELVAACRDAGFSPRIVQEAVAMPTIVSLVATQIGVSLVPSSLQQLARPDVAYRELDGLTTRAELAMISLTADRSALLEAFTASVRRTLAATATSTAR
jgi:DNA-binding transcriptional LysR family regulator